METRSPFMLAMAALVTLSALTMPAPADAQVGQSGDELLHRHCS
jgi:hypothetical protein